MSSQNGPAYRASMALMLLSAMAMLMMRSVAPTDAVTDAGGVRARSADLPSDCNQDRAIRPVLTPDLASLQRVAVPNGVRVDVSLMPAPNGMETSGKTGASGDGDARPSSFPLVVVRSGDGVSPRDTGVAVGRLLADETRSFVRDFIPSVTAKIEKLIRESKYEELTKIFPGWFLKEAIEVGLESALKLTALATKAFTPRKYLDEMRGYADGAGVDFDDIIFINSFPELVKASCSIVIASGNATKTGDVAQVRALDYGLDLAVWKYPVVLGYSLAGSVDIDAKQQEFVSVTFPGMVGSITGMNRHIGISEKVWLGDDASNDSRFGTPFPLVMRDVVQMFDTVEDGIRHVQDAKRTCSIFLGVGGRREHAAASGDILLTDSKGVTIYDDANYNEVFPANETAGRPPHFVRPGLVYVDKHVQPSRFDCMNALMETYYGALDARVLAEEVIPLAMTGDLHAAVYDFTSSGSRIYVSFPHTDESSDGHPRPAYSKNFVRMNLDDIFDLINSR